MKKEETKPVIAPVETVEGGPITHPVRPPLK